MEKELYHTLSVQFRPDRLPHEVSENLKKREPLLTNSMGKQMTKHSKKRHEFVKSHPTWSVLHATSARKCTETIVEQDTKAKAERGIVNNLLAHTPGVARSHYTRIADSEMARAMDIVDDAMERYDQMEKPPSDSSSSTSKEDRTSSFGMQEQEANPETDLSGDASFDNRMKTVFSNVSLRGESLTARQIRQLFPSQKIETNEIRSMQANFKYKQEIEIEIPDWIDTRLRRADMLGISEF